MDRPDSRTLTPCKYLTPYEFTLSPLHRAAFQHEKRMKRIALVAAIAAIPYVSAQSQLYGQCGVSSILCFSCTFYRYIIRLRVSVGAGRLVVFRDPCAQF